jgi:hypothetical protein
MHTVGRVELAGFLIYYTRKATGLNLVPWPIPT